MKVAIVGGGIGGMTLALSLHDAGITDVDVYESSRSVKELGVGVNVLPHAVRELAELGLLEELYQVGIPTEELAFYSTHGKRVWAEPRGLKAGYRWPQFSINRGEMLGVLHRAAQARLGSERIHPGHAAVRVGQQPGGSAWVEFANRENDQAPKRIEADVVVGCDGIHSVVRGTLFPDEGLPKWNGAVLYRGLTVGKPFLAGRTMIQLGHTLRMLVAYPISKSYEDRGDALLNWVVIYKKPTDQAMPQQDWDRHASLEDALEAFSGSVFDFIDHEALIRSTKVLYKYPFVDRDPLPTWDFGRITLLGDAAHPMYPLGSNGLSHAVVDARALAYDLAMQPSVEAAITAYDADRREATNTVVRANRLSPQELSLNLVEQRAPNGFDRLSDVISRQEMENISNGYRRTSGFDPEVLNHQPSRSVPPRKGA